MDINEKIIKEEVTSFVHSLQKLLPKKKEIIIVEQKRSQLFRLSDVHSEAKNVFPKCFIGAKLIVLREMMNKVKLIQHYNYGKSKDNYKCFSQLIHKEMDTKSVDDGLLLDSSGCATATYTEALGNDYDMRLTSRIRDLVSSETELLFEKDNDKSLGSIAFSVKDVDPNTLRMVTQWMYRVLPEFSIGTEVGMKPLAYPPTPDFSMSARYERATFSLSSTISRAGFQVCLYKLFAPDLRMATVLHDGTKTGATSMAVALHKSYSNGSELKIFVDSQRCGGFTFQKDVLFQEPHSEIRVLRLIGSTLIDRQRRVRFGIGFHLDF